MESKNQNFNVPHPLHFDKQGNFRILTLSDIHAQTDLDIQSQLFCQSIIKSTHPDLIVLLGDQISHFKNEGDNIPKAIDNIMQPIIESGIPFAVVFGNHDIETGMKLEDQMKIYQKYPNCLGRPSIKIDSNCYCHDQTSINDNYDTNDRIFEYEKEDVQVSGCGNYNLLVKDSKNEKFIFNLWFLDSGNVDSIFVKPDQVEWYDKEYQKIQTEVNQFNSEISKTESNEKIHSLWFMHRSIDEIYDFFNTSDFPYNTTAMSKGYRFGSFLSLKTEKDDPSVKIDPNGVFVEGPDLPDFSENVSNLYSHWLMNGDVIGACFGHDHGNSFYGFTKDNIGLGFDSAAGFLHAYPFPGVERGARIFDINENDTSTFYTQMIYCSQVMKNKKVSLLEKIVTYGNFNKAIIFLTKTLIPRPLQKYISKKLLNLVSKSFCPEHMRDKMKS